MNIAYAAADYIPLAQGTPLTDGNVVHVDNLSTYIQSMFKLGIGIAAALAVLMIIIGGIQYMSSDAMGGKEAGKERITSALWGLLIALMSVLLLQTINPQILSTSLDSVKNAGLDSTAPGAATPGVPYSGTDSSFNGTGSDFSPTSDSANAYVGQPNPNAPRGSEADAILQSAEVAADPNNPLSTSCPATNNGHLGCAKAVNDIVSDAIGTPISDSLSTTDMQKDLSNNSKFNYVGNDLSQAQPGDIIISPTVGNNTGHVGIAATQGATSIISNSSQTGTVKANFTATTWQNYYVNNKGLQVYIYRAGG